jgi:hypothetical protein
VAAEGQRVAAEVVPEVVAAGVVEAGVEEAVAASRCRR